MVMPPGPVPMIRMEEARPELSAVKRALARQPPGVDIAANPHILDRPHLRGPDGKFTEEGRLIQAQLRKTHGANLHARGDYDGARAAYLLGVKEIMGPDAVVPARYAREAYKRLSFPEFMDMMALANNIALTYMRQKNVEEALSWLEEVEQLNQAQVAAQRINDFDWVDIKTNAIEYYTIRMKAKIRRSEIFEQLHNTAQASEGYRWVFILVRKLDRQFHFVDVPKELKDIGASAEKAFTSRVAKLRHPDASLAHLMHNITQPKLQIRGSWQKVRTKDAIGSRMGACVFVWNSRLYVFGGRGRRKSGWKFYTDLHYLDLAGCSDTPEGWRTLPDLPDVSQWTERSAFAWRFQNWNMVVHDNAAWLFTGVQQLAKFDLVSETWSLVQTTMPDGSWPYDRKLEEAAMAVHDGVMYVFGGVDQKHNIGHDQFMALDLKTLRWKHISGTSDPVVKKSSPDLRLYPGCWVDPVREKLYILYGAAATVSTPLEALRGTEDYVFHNLWSFHVPSSTWRQERLHGNVPCPRGEFHCTFNPLLNKVFLFGGFNHGAASNMRDGRMFSSTFFADTFMWSPETETWSQVMTQGFPTHRAQAPLVTDPDTGRIYLFGGYSSPRFTGKDKEAPPELVRTHADVWRLYVDLPGGDLDKINLEEEGRLAALGAESRCFACGEIGRGFRKCGGSCGGAVCFCSKECQVEAWAEHKEMHGCRKGSGGK